MTINELKIACYLYERFTDYDKGYKQLRAIPSIDLNSREHAVGLLNWLRSWGCRQFKVEDTDLSVLQLTEWYSRDSTLLPDSSIGLMEGETNLFATTIGLFNRLQNLKISERRNSTVNVGPVGAAKILFALRPNFYSPWDRPICKWKKYSLNGNGYINYLKDIKETLLTLEGDCTRMGMTLSELAKITKRPLSSLPKMIDEFNWITITNKCEPSEIIKLIN